MMWESILLGLVLSGLMGALGYWRRALDASGVAGAVLVGTLIFGLGGWVWGLLLITFFVSSSWLSHYRRADKREISEKFAKGSRRDLGQALANGGLGALLAVVFALYPEPVLFAGFVGVMATVNADTWATELGVLSPDLPRLVTTGQRVSPGTSGGITLLGTWASLAGALLIGAMAALLLQIDALLSGGSPGGFYAPLRAHVVAYPLLAVAGGLGGSFLDSLMGATVQGIYYCSACAKETESALHRCGQPARPVRGWPWLNNDLVNLLASIGGGLLAASLAWIVWR
ncbi:MAG: DUF92 domain-containing protein [Anaerolineae bacterium]|jgi:uncharacterized protein (TIGR00297 family)